MIFQNISSSTWYLVPLKKIQSYDNGLYTCIQSLIKSKILEISFVLVKLILPLLILALIFSMSDSRSFCLFKAFTASGPVTATILRIPLAMASSDAMMKGPMWPALLRWVPPQNSTEVLVPDGPEKIRENEVHQKKIAELYLWQGKGWANFLPVGSFVMFSTGTPMLTTRTGSGYVSSKTALRPCIAFAKANGVSLA